MPIPTGLFVDEQGVLWGSRQQGTKPSTPRKLAQVRLDGNGMPDAQQIAHILDRMQTDNAPSPLVLACRLSTYEDIVKLQDACGSHLNRRISIPTAAALEYVISGNLQGDRHLCTISRMTDDLEVGVFDYADEALDTSYLRYRKTERGETLHDQAVAIANVLRSLWPLTEPWSVVVLEDDRALARELHKLFSRQGISMQLDSKPHLFCASGAAYHAMILDGAFRLLLLDATPFAFGVACGEQHVPLIARETTVPTMRTDVITVDDKDRLFLEMPSFVEQGRVQSYEIELSKAMRKALWMGGSLLMANIVIDVGLRAVLQLTASGGATQRIRLSDLLLNRPQRTASRPDDLPAGLMELVSVLDDTDLGLRALSQRDLASPAGQGLIALQKRLLQAIESLGATHYPALGTSFDPNVHEAMAVVNDPTLPHNYVVDEVRRGFSYQGRIVRYSLVRVANPR